MMRLLRLPTLIVVAGLLIATVVFIVPKVDLLTTSPGVGGMSAKLLRAWPYPNLIVEVDTERALPAEGLEEVLGFLSRYTDKLSVSIEQTVISTEIIGAASVEDVIGLHALHRDRSPISFLTVSIHILVLDRLATEDIVGFAYGASSAALFISNLADSVIHIMMAHEIGHLLGLSCVVFDEPAGEDWGCDGTGHSTRSDSLMAAAVRIFSPFVSSLELLDSEISQLEYIKAN